MPINMFGMNGNIHHAYAETRDLFGIEIFSAGVWNNDRYTISDLDSMVEAHALLGNRLNPPLKLGHDDAQNFLQASGLPSFGWIDKIYRRGEKLLADIRGIPQKIFDLFEDGAYRKRSVEILWDWQDSESRQTFSRVLAGLALLGAEFSAVSNLDAILALYGAEARDCMHVYSLNLEGETFSLNEENKMQTFVDARKWRSVSQEVAEREVETRIRNYMAKGFSHSESLDQIEQFDDDGRELCAAYCSQSFVMAAKDHAEAVATAPYKGAAWVESEAKKFRAENAEDLQGLDRYDCMDIWAKSDDANMRQYTIYIQNGGA